MRMTGMSDVSVTNAADVNWFGSKKMRCLCVHDYDNIFDILVYKRRFQMKQILLASVVVLLLVSGMVYSSEKEAPSGSPTGL